MAKILSLVVTILGVATLHYNESSGAEHHAEFAASSGLPAPSWGLWLLGAVATVAGAIWFGFALGRRARDQSVA